MTDYEQEAVFQLLNMAERRPTVFWELARKRWFQDDHSLLKHQAVMDFAIIARIDKESAEKVIRMPFLDSIEVGDLAVLQTLGSLDAGGLRWLLSQESLASTNADVLPAHVALLRLEWELPGSAVTLTALPWVEDGVSPQEVSAVFSLHELALNSQTLFRALASKTWAQDGLNNDERTVVRALGGMVRSPARWDQATALRLAAMPFLETVEGADAAAARSLNRLFWESDERNYLMETLAHPTLQDNISDDEAFVVAALAIVVRDRPDLLDTLLDLGVDAVEKRTAQLPLAGEVTLSVLNVNSGSYRTMDILEQALRAQERFMDVPFPKSYVGLLVADVTEAAGGGGPSGLITVDPGYVEDEYIIAHELAHVYWPFWPAWVAEGGADFMTTVSVNKRVSSHDCSLGNTLSHLDRLYAELSENGRSTAVIRSSGCAYGLGRGLFLDLHETLGDEAFRRGFGRLYLAMRDDALYGECAGPEKGLCYVRAAFITDATPEAASLAEPVITRWYYGPRQ